MKAGRKTRIVVYCVLALLTIICTTAAWFRVLDGAADMRKSETAAQLALYSETISLKIKDTLNEARPLARAAGYMGLGSGVSWFEESARILFQRPEVAYVGLFSGDTLVSSLPDSAYGMLRGHNLKDFNFIYTMAKVLKDSVVEGPMSLDGSGESVFMFMEPIVDPETNAYLGEVAVALTQGYVLDQLGITGLDGKGFDYEFWRIDPQTGSKRVVARGGVTADFSDAAKSTLFLPTQYVLSIQPSGGWITAGEKTLSALLYAAVTVLLLCLLFSIARCIAQRKQLFQLSRTDQDTGLYSRAGFLSAIGKWLTAETGPFALFYVVFEDYNRTAQLIGADEERSFLEAIPNRLKEYIKSPYIAGRIGESNYIIAVKEEMSDLTKADFAGGIVLELLWKTRHGKERLFLNARCAYADCSAAQGTAERQITALIEKYYAD